MGYQREHRQCHCVQVLRLGLEVGGAGTVAYMCSLLKGNANRSVDSARG